MSPFFYLLEIWPEIFQPDFTSVRTTDLFMYNYSPQFCSLHEQSTTYVSLLHHASSQFRPQLIVPLSFVWHIAQAACLVQRLDYGMDIRRIVVRVSVHPKVQTCSGSPPSLLPNWYSMLFPQMRHEAISYRS